MEEMTPDGISSRAQMDAATLAAWHEANDLKGRDVFDVNGVRLGKVTRAFAEEGALLRFDVTLTDNARTMMGAPQDVAGIPPQWVARVGEDGVRLRKAAEEVLHPDAPFPTNAELDARGAKGQPRKVR